MTTDATPAGGQEPASVTFRTPSGDHVVASVSELDELTSEEAESVSSAATSLVNSVISGAVESVSRRHSEEFVDDGLHPGEYVTSAQITDAQAAVVVDGEAGQVVNLHVSKSSGECAQEQAPAQANGKDTPQVPALVNPDGTEWKLLPKKMRSNSRDAELLAAHASANAVTVPAGNLHVRTALPVKAAAMHAMVHSDAVDESGIPHSELLTAPAAVVSTGTDLHAPAPIVAVDPQFYTTGRSAELGGKAAVGVPPESSHTSSEHQNSFVHSPAEANMMRDSEEIQELDEDAYRTLNAAAAEEPTPTGPSGTGTAEPLAGAAFSVTSPGGGTALLPSPDLASLPSDNIKLAECSTGLAQSSSSIEPHAVLRQSDSPPVKAQQANSVPSPGSALERKLNELDLAAATSKSPATPLAERPPQKASVDAPLNGIDPRVSKEQTRRNLTNLVDRLQYKKDLRDFVTRINEHDRQGWDRSKGIAEMIKLRVSRIVSSERDTVKFLRKENAIREYTQRNRVSFGAAHPSTEWVSQMWKAAAFTHPTDEHGDRKEHAALCRSIIHVDEHFAELKDLVTRVESHAKESQQRVNEKWTAYIHDLNEEVDALDKGVHPFEDSYLSRRTYEREVESLEDQKYDDSLETVIKDMALSEERRLADSKRLLLDFFTKEENALREQLAIVSKARAHISSIDPAEHVTAFLDRIAQFSLKYETDTRESILERSLLPSEVVKTSDLEMHRGTPPKPDTTERERLKQGKWHPCIAVLTVSGFFHVFDSKSDLKPHVSFPLRSLENVGPCLDFGKSSHCFQFADRTRLSWYQVFADSPRFQFKAATPLLMHEWMSVLQARTS